jgi:hypothetical protein
MAHAGALSMKVKPFTTEQAQEFDRMTARLSPVARGMWVAIRMQMALANTYTLEDTEEGLGLLLRCPSETFLTVLEEFKLKSTACGLRVEKPPPEATAYMERTSIVRLVYEPDEKTALLKSSEAVRLQKYREDKRKKELIRIPENLILSEKNIEFAVANGMRTETVHHEFEKYKTHHAESLWTQRGWDELVWRKWVLNWVSYGRKQVLPNGLGSGLQKPPPFPPKTHPIERNQWRMAYGDPKQYGYE